MPTIREKGQDLKSGGIWSAPLKGNHKSKALQAKGLTADKIKELVTEERVLGDIVTEGFSDTEPFDFTEEKKKWENEKKSWDDEVREEEEKKLQNLVEQDLKESYRAIVEDDLTPEEEVEADIHQGAPLEASGGISRENLVKISDLYSHQKEEEEELSATGLSKRSIELITRLALRQSFGITEGLADKLVFMETRVEELISENVTLIEKVKDYQELDNRLAELEAKVDRLNVIFEEGQTEKNAMTAANEKILRDINRAKNELIQVKREFRKKGVGGSAIESTPGSDHGSAASAVAAKQAAKTQGGLDPEIIAKALKNILRKQK